MINSIQIGDLVRVVRHGTVTRLYFFAGQQRVEIRTPDGEITDAPVALTVVFQSDHEPHDDQTMEDYTRRNVNCPGR